MRPWTAISALGVVGIAAGATLVALQLHHTIGLAGIGLGAVLLVIGAGGSILTRKGTRVEAKRPAGPKTQGTAYRKAIAAVLVVVLIGVGTYYATSYVADIQPGASQSGTTTTGSGLGSQVTGATSGSSGGGISTYYANTTSVTTSTTSLGTASGGTSIGTTGTSAVTDTSSAGSTGSTGTSTSSGSSTSISTGNTGTTSETGTSSATSSTSETSTASSTSSASEPFILSGSPSVTVQGQQVSLYAQYTNTETSAVQVNIHANVYDSSGNLYASADLISPAPTISPNGNFNADAGLGSYPSGSYTVTFFVVDGSGTQLSSPVTIAFVV